VQGEVLERKFFGRRLIRLWTDDGSDLDAAIDAMMRGATLPPFPGDMTASDVEVSVTVRFSLTR
jgi:hypothetical protein